jgi:phosphatidate cytidylyltransferase
VTDDNAAPADRGLRNLLMRVVTAAVMVPVAIGIAYAGGWLWLGLVTLAAIGLYVEWLMIVGGSAPRPIAAGAIALVVAALSFGLGWLNAACAVFAVGVVVVAFLAGDRRGWSALGACYAFAALFASIVLRLDPVWGFTALMFVLLIVWVTDIGGFFAGRGIGGPKLWPRVSPKKTWAGAIGGLVGSLCVAAVFNAWGFGRLSPLLLLAIVLTVVSQLGDLFESAVKRKFGVKDSSQIIPGHGGLLDRLDGYVFAVVAAALIGVLRDGADGAGRGLMIW